MSATASVAITRTGLTLPDLTIGSGTFLFTPDGLGDPGITWRRTKMPDSADVHGSETIAAVKEEADLPLGVFIRAASGAAVQTAYEELATALDQFSYTVTRTVDGVARVWTAGPADYSRGPIREDEQSAFICKVAITIPVYPIPGA